MTHLSLSQTFLVLVPKPAVSLQLVSPLSPSLSSPPQYLVGLQPTIILALNERRHLLLGVGQLVVGLGHVLGLLRTSVCWVRDSACVGLIHLTALAKQCLLACK